MYKHACLRFDLNISYSFLFFKEKVTKMMIVLFSEIILILTVEILSLLHQPHNIVLISGMLIFQDILAKYYVHNVYYLMALYQSLGMVFYFYQVSN